MRGDMTETPPNFAGLAREMESVEKEA